MPCHKVLSGSLGGFGHCSSPGCSGAGSTGVLVKPGFVISMGFYHIVRFNTQHFLNDCCGLVAPAHWISSAFLNTGDLFLSWEETECWTEVCTALLPLQQHCVLRVGTQPGSGPAVLQQRCSCSPKMLWSLSSSYCLSLSGKSPLPNTCFTFSWTPAALQTRGTFITEALSFHAFT